MLKSSVKVLWAARVDYKPGWSLTKHCHEYFQMILIIEGNGEMTVDQKKYKLNKNLLIFLKPDSYHGLQVDQNSCLKSLDIKFKINNSDLKTRLENTSVKYKNIECSKFLLEKIREEGFEKKHLYKEISSLYLYNILLNLLRKNKKEQINNRRTNLFFNTEDEVCNKFIDFIKENYNRPLKLKNIARELNYNKIYICQRIKEILGFTPMELLYKYRIEVAKELITFSDFSLKQIADKTGFKTIHHFSRKFKKHQNVPPGEYKNKKRTDLEDIIYLSEDFDNKNIINQY